MVEGSHRGPLNEYGVGTAVELDFKTLMVGDLTFNVGGPKILLHIVPSEPGDLVIWNLRTYTARAREG